MVPSNKVELKKNGNIGSLADWYWRTQLWMTSFSGRSTVHGSGEVCIVKFDGGMTCHGGPRTKYLSKSIFSPVFCSIHSRPRDEKKGRPLKVLIWLILYLDRDSCRVTFPFLSCDEEAPPGCLEVSLVTLGIYNYLPVIV